MTRFRFLPITIAAAILLLTLKVGEVWQSAGVLGTKPSIAAEHETGEAADNTETDKDAFVEEAGDDLVDRLKTPDVIDVSPTEIRMLENLLARRTRLEKWENDIDMREKLLAATEARINEKINHLKAINQNIDDLVTQFNAREDEKITRLVKIYETMKPKDAARIFNELELDILLEMLVRMREAKAALIIAKMDSSKAKTVTSEFATRRSLLDTTEETANAFN